MLIIIEVIALSILFMPFTTMTPPALILTIFMTLTGLNFLNHDYSTDNDLYLLAFPDVHITGMILTWLPVVVIPFIILKHWISIKRITTNSKKLVQ